MRTFAWTLSIAVAMSAGTALAAQNVANTSQKGSLLIWPNIDIEGRETLIEISNDANKRVHVECYYVNGKKGRVDFDFDLTPKQTASWSVASRAGDQVTPPAFPVSGTYPYGSIYRGMLACFATDAGATKQIAFNHLTGTATVIGGGAPKYNAWSFVARNAAGLPQRDYVQQGTPGHLQLTGAGYGTYDACPSYNIVNFMPNGGALDGLATGANYLAVASCNQDLRQDYNLYLTKLKFTVWNSFEHSFTGAYQCIDSVDRVYLGAGNTALVNGSHFEYGVLKTPNARFDVRGVASTQCNALGATSNAGLLGVIESSTNHGMSGTTTHGAGATPGFVLWDPRSGPEFRPRQ
jgi:hypothetical protein